MTDELNPGITKTVELLRAAGFNTVDSGDGETHDYECDRDYGYVSILADPAKLCQSADDVRMLLESRGVKVVALTEEGEPPEGCCFVSTYYCPVDTAAIVDIQYIHDDMLDDEEN